MKARMWIPVAIFLSGLVLIAVSVATGQGKVSLVVFFPVFSGSSALFLLGMLLIIVSFFVGFAMLMAYVPASEIEAMRPTDTSLPQRVHKSTEYGGVVMIGPIPIAFGSNKNIAIIMLIVGIALVVVLFVALFLIS